MLTIRLTMHKLQILDAVVSANAVDMMHTLSGKQRPAKATRHHKTMFEYVTAINTQVDVAIRTQSSWLAPALASLMDSAVAIGSHLYYLLMPYATSKVCL